jgi:hypothetical protein
VHLAVSKELPVGFESFWSSKELTKPIMKQTCCLIHVYSWFVPIRIAFSPSLYK